MSDADEFEYVDGDLSCVGRCTATGADSISSKYAVGTSPSCPKPALIRVQPPSGSVSNFHYNVQHNLPSGSTISNSLPSLIVTSVPSLASYAYNIRPLLFDVGDDTSSEEGLT